MKTKAELDAIRKATLAKVTLQGNPNGMRVLVGMATCGIAAGARPVLKAFEDQVGEKKLDNIQVSQTGCIGVCRLEPMVEVFAPGKEKVTYVKMTPDMVGRIVDEHLIGGKPVIEYTIGYYEAHNK